MKKLIFIFILTSLVSYGLQKSGVKEYDNLDLTKGKSLKYYDEDSNVNDYYMKEYNSNIEVTFYSQTDTPYMFIKMNTSENNKTFLSKALLYNKNGTLEMSSEYKNEKLNGKASFYNDGVLWFTSEYKDGIQNGEQKNYIDGKIAYLKEYKEDKLNGKIIYYDKNNEESVIENYEDGKFISSKNVNYKLQKTGIPEYDNIDFSKGEIIAYYNDKGEFISKDSNEAVQYRKSFGKKDGYFLIVDYYINTNNVQAITETKKIYLFDNLGEEKMNFSFSQNGAIAYSHALKEDEITTEVRKYNYFGNLKSISTYKKRRLINTKYTED